MSEVTTLRLHVLRAAYLLIAGGLGLLIWPGLIHPPAHIEHARGVMRALLGAVGLLAVLGLRYPLQMLPLLLFELTWKSIWIIAFGLPLWRAGALDAATRATLVDCGFGVVLCVLVIPWRYVVDSYILRPGEPWRRRGQTAVAHEPVAG